MGERAHLGWLDALRALAALWVVGCHALGTVAFVPHGPFEGAIYGLLNAGHFAVTAFIAISGFSLALGPSRKEWRLADGYREFIVARWIRIAPPFYASMALSLALIATLIGAKTGTHWDVSIPIRPVAVLGHLFLVQNFVGAPEINHAYWSVALEFQIYLFFGLYLAGMRRRGEIGVLGVGFVLALASVVLHFAVRPLARHGWLNTDHFYPAAYLLVFAFGIVACARSNRPLTRNRGGLALLSTALMVGATQMPASVLFFPDVLFGLGASLALLLLASAETLPRPLRTGPLVFGGRASYSLYLVHAPILQAVYVAAGAWTSRSTFSAFAGFCAAAIPATLLVAFGFYVAVERPSFRLRHVLRRNREKARPLA